MNKGYYQDLLKDLKFRRYNLDKEIEELKARVHEEIGQEIGLPTTPGWYYVPGEDVMALLVGPDSEFGTPAHWTDGYGNAWEDIENLEGCLPVKLPKAKD